MVANMGKPQVAQGQFWATEHWRRSRLWLRHVGPWFLWLHLHMVAGMRLDVLLRGRVVRSLTSEARGGGAVGLRDAPFVSAKKET